MIGLLHWDYLLDYFKIVAFQSPNMTSSDVYYHYHTINHKIMFQPVTDWEILNWQKCNKCKHW